MAKTGPKPKAVTCHPGRKHRALGLCERCYKIAWSRRKGIKEQKRNNAICHPDRLANGHGLCSQCYQAKHYLDSKQSQEFVARRRSNTRKWYRSNKQRASDYQCNRNKTHKALMTARRLKVPIEEVEKALQIPCCEICAGTFKLAVDHCHDTGRVRGRLCAKCNMAIGLLNEDRNRVLMVADYLNRASA